MYDEETPEVLASWNSYGYSRGPVQEQKKVTSQNQPIHFDAYNKGRCWSPTQNKTVNLVLPLKRSQYDPLAFRTRSTSHSVLVPSQSCSIGILALSHRPGDALEYLHIWIKYLNLDGILITFYFKCRNVKMAVGKANDWRKKTSILPNQSSFIFILQFNSNRQYFLQACAARQKALHPAWCTVHRALPALLPDFSPGSLLPPPGERGTVPHAVLTSMAQNGQPQISPLGVRLQWDCHSPSSTYSNRNQHIFMA